MIEKCKGPEATTTDSARSADDAGQPARSAPSAMAVDVGVVKVGRPSSEGVMILASHITTPETASTTHYFLGSSRNFAMHVPQADQAAVAAREQAVGCEDIPMLELQQAAMGDSDFWKLKPVILANDGGAVRVRRTFDKMLRDQTDPKEKAAA